MLSCHIELVWLGVCSASPACAPRPSAVRGGAFAGAHPASPPRSVEYAERNHNLPSFVARWGCHDPCPGTGAAATLASARDAPPRLASMVCFNSFASGTLAPSITIPSGPPSASTNSERFTPFFARSVGFGPIRSPQNAPCPSRRRRPATAS